MDEIWQSLHCYWVEKDKLLAGALPGRSSSVPAEQQLTRLHLLGVRQIIDLTESDESDGSHYAGTLRQVNKRMSDGIGYAQFPIVDMGTPSTDLMRRVLALIAESNRAGKAVYVHCFGGLGRTGTVVGCYLVQQGYSAEDALERIPRLRSAAGLYNFPSPEVTEQVEFIHNWKKTAL